MLHATNRGERESARRSHVRKGACRLRGRLRAHPRCAKLMSLAHHMLTVPRSWNRFKSGAAQARWRRRGSSVHGACKDAACTRNAGNVCGRLRRMRTACTSSRAHLWTRASPHTFATPPELRLPWPFGFDRPAPAERVTPERRLISPTMIRQSASSVSDEPMKSTSGAPLGRNAQCAWSVTWLCTRAPVHRLALVRWL